MLNVRRLFQHVGCSVSLHAWGERQEEQDYYPAKSLVGGAIRESIIEKHRIFRQCDACHLERGEETTIIDSRPYRIAR